MRGVGGAVTDDEWNLRIDEQVNAFLDLNHKLTFFLITAAVASLAFTVNLAVANRLDLAGNKALLALLSLGAFLGLISAGTALLALHADIGSFRLHLKYRYQRKTYDQLSVDERKKWDQFVTAAQQARRFAFAMLIASVTAHAAFLISGFAGKGPQ